MAARFCRVSFRDADGVLHTADVEADTVYEAALLALSSLTRDEWVRGIDGQTRLDVRILQPGCVHSVSVSQVGRWLQAPGADDAELEAKRKLRRLLAS